ncbi:DMT family transporter [Limnoraphis robusta]|uniref:SMR family transporter n=1 Tax=Limnoraphis robusta CCNP1315 TaxID=3110306 RepID=A0ABU5U5W9_9CYAN|nr:SMR family transporter [Limnoraphis robusta]MEA5499909.1 SMR family transporter [Limnoraphis robusta BA-68 BA1]MEA5521533.1 SMR family transporter [Limnoraphis robusta CCNP1315]MEA5543923.1 SMR family transporter [Limnoraphis robusta CCNP1324]
MNLNISGWGFVLIAAINNSIGSLLLKKSRLVATDPSLIGLLLSPWFIAGLCVYGINVILFAKALEKLPVSVAYPVFAAIGFSLIALGGGWFFGEQLEINQWIGLGMILAGIIIMSR